jgi:hypothetical protein
VEGLIAVIPAFAGMTRVGSRMVEAFSGSEHRFYGQFHPQQQGQIPDKNGQREWHV